MTAKNRSEGNRSQSVEWLFDRLLQSIAPFSACHHDVVSCHRNEYHSSLMWCYVASHFAWPIMPQDSVDTKRFQSDFPAQLRGILSGFFEAERLLSTGR